MLLDNRTKRKEMEIEELIGIVLVYVNTAGDSHSNGIDSLRAISTLLF